MDDIRTVITLENAKISCNFDQVESAIKEILAEYQGAVFTEDSKSYAKKIVASLRGQKKTFQDNLREEKKKYMQPWEDFEAQAKRLIAMYDEPIELINGQVQAFEKKRIAEKKQLIARLYEEIVSDELAAYIPLDRIYNVKWENASVKEKEIRKEIEVMAEKVRRDIDTISGMESEVIPEALSRYRADLDLTNAVSYINSYERQKQEILMKERERQQREAEERIRREERERLLDEQRLQMEQEEAARQADVEKSVAVEQARAEGAQEVIDSLIPDMDDETSLYEYRISLSDDAKEKLEMYMDSVGIEWEMI